MKTRILLLIILCSSFSVNAQIDTTITDEALELAEKVINDCQAAKDSLNREIKKLSKLDQEKSLIINKTLNKIDESVDVIEEKTDKAIEKIEKSNKLKNYLIGGFGAATGFIIRSFFPDT